MALFLPHLDTPIFKNIWGVWEKGSDNNRRVRGYEDVDVMISLPKSEKIEYQQPIFYQRKYQELCMDTLRIGAACDHTVSGASSAALARAGGWPQMVPYVFDAGSDQLAEAPFPLFYKMELVDLYSS